MGNIKYQVLWGTAFYHNSTSFSTLWEAQNFIKNSVFGDSRFCALRKIEELDADFTFAESRHFANKDVEEKMFSEGMVSKADYDQYYINKENK